jgi:hypothetical protein
MFHDEIRPFAVIIEVPRLKLNNFTILKKPFPFLKKIKTLINKVTVSLTRRLFSIREF